MKKALFILSLFFLSIASTVYGQVPYSGSNSFADYFMIGIIILIAVLFIIRELVCWYWKINKRITIHQELLGTRKRILEEIRKDNKPVVLISKPAEIKLEERLKD